jgi:hypothetical protein
MANMFLNEIGDVYSDNNEKYTLICAIFFESQVDAWNQCNDNVWELSHKLILNLTFASFKPLLNSCMVDFWECWYFCCMFWVIPTPFEHICHLQTTSLSSHSFQVNIFINKISN